MGCACRANATREPLVGDVELGFPDCDETVPAIEAVGIALAQRADAEHPRRGRRAGEQGREHRAPQPAPLVGHVDVEVLDPHCVLGLEPKRDTAHRPTTHNDLARVGRPERLAKPLARANGVEAAEALQALAHRGDAQHQQRFEVSVGHGLERERDRHGCTT
jgi:hypothetical protein